LAELSRTTGRQEEEIRRLTLDIAARDQAMGESTGKLAGEKGALERELADKKEQLAKQTAVAQGFLTVVQERQRVLGDLRAVLQSIYPDSIGVKISLSADDRVQVLLPDKKLFDAANGVQVSGSGKTLLQPLANILANNPEFNVEIVVHTDNVLPPKDKSLRDTWDWSALRAGNIVRTFIRELNVNANQLTPIGRGEFYPLSSNATPEGRAENRRAIVLIRPALPGWPATGGQGQ
jgi:chemotaxis protein MotB